MNHYLQELEALEREALRRKLRWVEGAQGRMISLNGQEVLNFASNDYLGLAAHPRLKEAMCEGVARWGVGSAASRLITGSMAAHRGLEDCLAEKKGTEAALSFATGYATSVGTLSALMGKGDTIILDKLAHASLIDGARLSGATVRVFPHNGLAKLQRLLESASQSGGRVLVVTESVFSMDGDVAKLAEIIALKDKWGALLLLDEAHGLGVLGDTGMGLAEALHCSAGVDIHMGTLGKAAGVAGGYIASSQAIIDWVINKGRAFIYSTAPPPAQAYTAMKAIELISSAEGEALRAQLWATIHHFSKLLDLDASSAIIPWQVGEADAALALSAALLENGIFAPAIRYPTVPRNTARLRITLTAAHSLADATRLAEVINEAG